MTTDHRPGNKSGYPIFDNDSLEVLSTKLNVAESYLAMVKDGTRILGLTAKLKWAHILGVPMEDLFGPEAEEQKEG